MAIAAEDGASQAGRDRYYNACVAAMHAYCEASVAGGRIPTLHGCMDAAVQGFTAAFVRDKMREVVSGLGDCYIDDATGAEVNEDWWPGMPLHE